MATVSETVYGNQEEGHVMSEKVSSLATNIYKEFERMIKKYDEEVVKELMPLTVGLLEGLDQALRDKQESEVELELIRDDNEQLLTQYEREKQLRKAAEQKYLEMEDAVEGEKKELQDKTESMESIIRMLELKSKNSSDHIARMEEKEIETKKEYTKLHERYTELFRTHMDYMERTKILMGTDKLEPSNSPRTKFHLPNLRPVSMVLPGQVFSPKSTGTPPSMGIDFVTTRSPADSNISLRNELNDLESPDISNLENLKRRKSSEKKGTCDKNQMTDDIDVKDSGTTTKKVSKGETASGQESKAQIESVDKDRGDTAVTSDSSQILAQQNSPNVFVDRQEASISDKVQTVQQSSSESKAIDTKHIQSKTEVKEQSSFTERIENSVISTPDSKTQLISRGPSKEPSTSTPSSEENRVRFDSIEHEEADFEEDRIPGFEHKLDKIVNHIVDTTPELHSEFTESIESQSMGSSFKGGMRNDNSIFDELNMQDNDLGDDFGITGREVTPGEYASSDSEDENERRSTGMGKELENLILENTELLETKNALNVVKDDLIAQVDELSSEQEILKEEISSLRTVKDKLNQRIKDLEDELKKTKEELEKKSTVSKEEDEDDVPMAQRKRFTRVEMARVLMERNQYKERLMELQEAVRWTEMIRASREHPDIAANPHNKKKSSIWNFFSNLFSSPNKPSKKPLPAATVKYNAPTTQVQPVGDPNKERRSKLKLGNKENAYKFLEDDLVNTADRTSTSLEDCGSSKIESLLEEEPVTEQPFKVSEKAKKEREKERREQYKQVRAYVKKDTGGRLQAYGWSLPAKFQPTIPNKEMPSKNHVPVPVPVYCRPLFDKDSGLKIWCAAGVNLTGGRTRDGGSIVGASVFYSDPPDVALDARKDTKDEVERLNQELKDHEKNLKDQEKEQFSSYVWICTQTTSNSRVSVIDANNPGDILDTFRVSMSPILCIASVAGALESDYPVDEEILKAESYPQYKAPPPATDSVASSVTDNSGIGGISFVQCATGSASPTSSPVGSPHQDGDQDSLSAAVQDLSGSDEKLDTSIEHKDKADTESLMSERSYEAAFGDESHPSVFKAKGSPVSSGTATPTSTSSSRSLDRRGLSDHSEQTRDGISPLPSDQDLQFEEMDKMSSILPTMWLGSQSGSLYIHSSVTQWKRCLHSVKLRDSVLNIVHVKGRVLAALADGSVAIFHRATDGQWDLQNYHLLDLGKPHHSIRCMSVIANKYVWCGYRNKVHVVNPQNMTIEKTFDAHPRKESQVRQLAWLGDGVWVSIRLDSTLRLYHAYTYQHLQDVDIEPYVSKMLGTGKLGFSFVRITSMLISCNRLWIGTGNGVVISVPLSESNKQTVSTGSSGGRPGGIIRVYSGDNKSDRVTPGSFVPYCTMAQAQLSFHGHRDAVKFFAAVPVPTCPNTSSSGGRQRSLEDYMQKGNFPWSHSAGAPRAGISAATEENAASSPNRQEAIPALDTNTKLVLSGGEGYVDFRIGDGDEDEFIQDEERKVSLSKGDRSHLIVWEVTCQD